jgi:hypothetical protein
VEEVVEEVVEEAVEEPVEQFPMEENNRHLVLQRLVQKMIPLTQHRP